jgi:anti-sigma factor ChrR (cupin superfamily)
MTEYPAGWTCDVVVLHLQRYRLGTLSPADSLAIAEHLEACVVCYQRLVLVEPQGVGRRG